MEIRGQEIPATATFTIILNEEELKALKETAKETAGSLEGAIFACLTTDKFTLAVNK